MFFYYLNVVVLVVLAASFPLVNSHDSNNKTVPEVKYIGDYMHLFDKWLKFHEEPLIYFYQKKRYIEQSRGRQYNPPSIEKDEAGVRDIVEDLCTEDCDWERDEESKKYVIPFKIHRTYPDDDEQRIRKFIRTMSEYTNFDLIPEEQIDPQKHPGYYIFIYNGGRCRNRFGRVVKTGPQMMSITKTNCTDVAILSREFGHLFGLRNEHQRYDRDKYFRLDYLEFDRYFMNHMERIPFPDNRVGRILASYEYDTASITHCTTNEFSKDKNKGSLIPLNERFSAATEQERSLLSSCDWNKILTLYPGKVKPPPCIYNYRGYQYRYTYLCQYFYGVRNCHIACYFAGGRLMPHSLCEYATGLPILPPPSHVKMDPFLSVDADPSSDGREYKTRILYVLHDKELLYNYLK